MLPGVPSAPEACRKEPVYRQKSAGETSNWYSGYLNVYLRLQNLLKQWHLNVGLLYQCLRKCFSVSAKSNG